MLIDSHCHLDRLKLEQCGGSLDSALELAREASVERMLCVCISEENRDSVLEIAQKHKDVYASVGVHPSDVKEKVVSAEELALWANHSKVVALGETGLDYYYTDEFKAQQLESFANHLMASKTLGLPVIVHTRGAREDTLSCIKAHGDECTAGVLHCFTESMDMAKRAMDMNYYISISGIVTFKNAEELRDVAKAVPLDRLLVETDSPYLAPVPYRGKSNQPAYVKAVAQYLADLKGVSYERFCEITAQNFYQLFKKASEIDTLTA